MMSSISLAAGLLTDDSEGIRITLFDLFDSSRSTAGLVVTVCVVLFGLDWATLSMQDFIKSVSASL
jgi:hypothetical protein